jgi:hypothetical protein
VLIESGAVSEGSIKGVMSGKHYNRAVRSHKMMYEALQRLRFEAFLDTLDDGSHDEVISFVKTIQETFPHDVYEKIESDYFQDLLKRYEAFIADSTANSKTFAYWCMYIEMAGTKLYRVSQKTEHT